MSALPREKRNGRPQNAREIENARRLNELAERVQREKTVFFANLFSCPLSSLSLALGMIWAVEKGTQTRNAGKERYVDSDEYTHTDIIHRRRRGCPLMRIVIERY
jgi:leucyl aminopeptidase (aminopeptidase T)